jgi:hemerythrin-like domain-containing protein
MANPDGIALLKADHRAAKQLFRDFRATGDRAYTQRRRIVDKIITELSIHAGIEETVFYPQIREAVPRTEDEVLESLEEHHVVKLVLAELERMDPKDERFTAKVTVLMENVEHHIREEETELFPQVRKVLSRNELLRLGEEMAAAKAIVPKRPHPRSPDEPPGNIAAAALAVPADVVLEGVRNAVQRSGAAVRHAISDRE